MFSKLSDTLSSIFSALKKRGNIKEEDILGAMREIRIALLEADVSLSAIKILIENVKQKALGQQVLKSLSPDQMIVKIVQDEIEALLLCQKNKKFNFALGGGPSVFMMLGLQGSGKTTSTAKFALMLRQKFKKKVLLVSVDMIRPAAQKQLEVLAKQIDIDIFLHNNNSTATEVTKSAILHAKENKYDVLIIDTAGRITTDEELMQELKAIEKISSPSEKFLVVDSMLGQEAANVAREFTKCVLPTGIVLTRIDADGRGGAALSMKVETGIPIRFMGTGEKLNDFEEFHADRIASRILDMGDIASLVEKVSEAIDEDEMERLAMKLETGTLTMNDLLKQFNNIKKMGGFASVISMVPGFGKVKESLSDKIDEKTIERQKAIILSMTKKERVLPYKINASRKKRIAKGSGSTIQDVNKLIKHFLSMKDMMKDFGKMDSSKMKQLEKMMNSIKK